MTRSGEKTPSPPPSSGAGRSPPQKPARGPNTEAFGRFVSNLARLEGGAGRVGKTGLGKAGAERRGEGSR